MKGLRTQENDKFLNFWSIVQKEAEKMGGVFFLDCGEGNIYESDSIECEDLVGWLIPNDKTKEFEKLFLWQKNLDEWSSFLSSVTWENKGKISVNISRL